MEISKVNRSSAIQSEKKSISTKKDFSQNFNMARDRKSQSQLKEMLEDIKKKGNRLVITKCYADVRAYKNQIKEYLQSVLTHMYGVKKDISFWQTQYFVTVDTVDMHLEELTQMLLKDEKDNLKIASTIDDINGLIIDLYK